MKAHARVAKCLLQLGRFSDARRQLESAAAFPNAQASWGRVGVRGRGRVGVESAAAFPNAQACYLVITPSYHPCPPLVIPSYHPFPNAQATLAPDYATLTELEALMRNGKSALAQEGGAAGREALRCFGALAERCQQSLVIACMQMEACLRASPERGASQVVSESARWMRKAGCAQEP